MLTLLGAGVGSASPPGLPANTILGDTSVLFDATPTPLLYAAPNQINVIAPYALYGETSTQILVMQRGQAVTGLLLPVSDSAPSIFNVDGGGAGQGAILNQDQTLNSPANPRLIALFATGAGQTILLAWMAKPQPTSCPSPCCRVGSNRRRRRHSTLAGAVPGSVAGLPQVNCTGPSTSASGLSLPITLVIGKPVARPALRSRSGDHFR